MGVKGNLKFRQVSEPILAKVSKFGGQPNWLTEPEWPIDKDKNEKMSFIGQIELTPDLFGVTQGKMAYLFMNADDEADETWDPNSGQNAVIVQPGNNVIDTVPEATGPASTFGNDFEDEFDESGLCEFKLLTTLDEESDFLSEVELRELMDSDPDKHDDYIEKMIVSKIGGNPGFLQGEQLPIDGNWKFLCQLDEEDIPVGVNFGCGVAYAFIDSEGTYGKFLWQC